MGDGGWFGQDRPGGGIKPSTWPKPDVGSAVSRFLRWYSDKLDPVANKIREMLDKDKPKSIEKAVERYKDLPDKKTGPLPPQSGVQKYDIRN